MNLKPETYELILDSFPRGMIVTDPQGKVIFVNQKIKQILGYSAGHFMNKNFHNLVHRHSRQAECTLNMALHSLSSFTNQSDVFTLAPKTSVNVEYSTYPLVEDDELKGYLIRIRRELLAKQQQNKFIAGLGHELKTPITIISSYTHLLKQAYQEGNKDEFNQYLQVIDDRTETLTKLVHGLLDTIKLGSGKKAFNDKLLNLDEEISQIVEQLQKTIDTHHLKIAGQTGVKLKMDPARLFEVISNLVTNAVKYSPNQEEVLIKLKKHENYVQIQIKDFGEGISDEEAQHLFEPFFRTQAAQSRDEKGLGMGLFLSQQIINHYRGKIWFATDEQKGTTFFVNLPI